MPLPRQVRLSISYDGTVRETVTESVSGGTNGSAAGLSYTVVPGDTLWGIAKRFLGSGIRCTEIYDTNAAPIESAAKAHGKSSSGNGHWIWPGTVLSISGENTGTTTKTITRVTGTANPELGEKIASQCTGFTYTDVASGESDSMSVTMHDIGMEWIGEYKPKRGSAFGAKLVLINWEEKESEKTFDCGNFILDDISFSGRPLTCVLNGVSVPIMDDFKSLPHTKTWEKTTVEDIASEIAGRAGVSLYYEADTIQIAEIEQSKETDSAFLYSLCEKYGLSMKVYNHKIVIFDTVRYEEKDEVLTLHETDMISWSCDDTVEGTYTGVNLDYTDPDTEDTINVTMGSPGRMYAINTQASSRYDAELQAAAKVNAANRKIETMNVSIRANIKIVASDCIYISGLGSIDGKYFIDKIKHDVGKGYKMHLTMHRVQKPIKVTAPASGASGGGTYTVVSGDTLWGISKRFYGTGTKYGIIYDANAELIESTAKSHGKSSSDNGHWIWPGEVLMIPEG